MPKVLTEQQVRDFEEHGYLSFHNSLVHGSSINVGPDRRFLLRAWSTPGPSDSSRTAALLRAKPTAASGPRHDNRLTPNRSPGKEPTHVRR